MELLSEPFISPEQFEELTQRPRSAFYRYSRVGVGGVVLQTWRVGGRVMTTRSAVAEFIEQLSAARRPASRQPPTPARLRHEHEAAVKKLDAMGIK